MYSIYIKIFTTLNYLRLILINLHQTDLIFTAKKKDMISKNEPLNPDFLEVEEHIFINRRALRVDSFQSQSSCKSLQQQKEIYTVTSTNIFALCLFICLY